MEIKNPNKKSMITVWYLWPKIKEEPINQISKNTLSKKKNEKGMNEFKEIMNEVDWWMNEYKELSSVRVSLIFPLVGNGFSHPVDLFGVWVFA